MSSPDLNTSLRFVGAPNAPVTPAAPLYHSSEGVMEIAKMAPKHLDNAIAKAERTDGFDPGVLAALKAEAGKR